MKGGRQEKKIKGGPRPTRISATLVSYGSILGCPIDNYGLRPATPQEPARLVFRNVQPAEPLNLTIRVPAYAPS